MRSPWGERSVFVKDLFGNHWHIGTREGTGHVTPCLIPSKSPPVIDFLALIEMADIGEGEIAHPHNFYMFTDDVDAVYRRAVAAGPKAIVVHRRPGFRRPDRSSRRPVRQPMDPGEAHRSGGVVK